MIRGYARVSRIEQSLDMQIIDLEKYGCEVIYSEKISGMKKERPELDKMLSEIQNGDTLVVWRLDRLGRRTTQLINLIEEFREREIQFVSLRENIDTSTPMGKAMLAIIAALAEMERDIIAERSKAGQDAARLKGKSIGRKRGLTDENKEKAKKAKVFYQQGFSWKEMCQYLGVTKGTLSKMLKHENVVFERSM